MNASNCTTKSKHFFGAARPRDLQPPVLFLLAAAFLVLQALPSYGFGSGLGGNFGIRFVSATATALEVKVQKSSAAASASVAASASSASQSQQLH